MNISDSDRRRVLRYLKGGSTWPKADALIGTALLAEGRVVRRGRKVELTEAGQWFLDPPRCDIAGGECGNKSASVYSYSVDGRVRESRPVCSGGACRFIAGYKPKGTVITESVP